MKVDVKTPEGKKMTAQHAVTPLGAALRIAPAFLATVLDETAGIETTLEARYSTAKGRYVPVTIVSRGIGDDFDEDRLRHTVTQPILQAAVPYCVTVGIEDGTDTTWTTVADLTVGEGRIIPPWMAVAVTARGVKGERWDVIEILYGAAALAGAPPVKLISLELDIPERTATDWISKARTAGRLTGMTSNVGRPPGG